MISSCIGRTNGQSIEFLPTIDIDRLAETLIAFANSDGGAILMGVNENGEIDTTLMQEDIQDALRLALGPDEAAPFLDDPG